jgi:hypothetical protein
MASVGLFLGLVALAISLPSVAAEVALIMGSTLTVGYCMAVVIDLGFVACKVIDSLNDKFEFSKPQRAAIWTTMLTCLVMSAWLNASHFMKGAADPMMAGAFAVFISSPRG